MPPPAKRSPPGFAPRERATVWVGAVGQAAVVAGGLLPLPALMAVGAEGGAGLLMAGLAVGVFGLGQAFGQLPMALLSDARGRRWTVGFALGLLVVGSALAVLWPTPIGVVLGRAVAGMAALTAVALCWVDEVVPGQRGEKGLAVVAVSGGLAAVLGLPVGAGLGWAFGTSWTLLAVALPALAVALWAPMVRTEPPIGPGRRAALAPAVAVRLLSDGPLRRTLLGTVLLNAALVVAAVTIVVGAGTAPMEAPAFVRTLLVVGMALAGVLGLGAAARQVDAERWGRAQAVATLPLVLAGGLVVVAGAAGETLAAHLALAAAALLALAGAGAMTSTLAAAVVAGAPDSARPEATALWTAAGGLGLFAGGLLGAAALSGGGGVGAGILAAALAAAGGTVAAGGHR